MRRSSSEPGNVVDLLRTVAESEPDVEAYVEFAAPLERRSTSFGALDRAADAVAALFARAGVSKGEIVALGLPSSVDYAVCYHAALRLGAITSGINPRLGRRERSHILARLAPRVTVTDTAGPEIAGPEMAGSEMAGPEMAGPDTAGSVTLRREEVVAAIADAESYGGARAPRLPTIDPSDPVAVVWTGGSTGVPKGALFDHRRLHAVAAGSDVLSRPGDRRLSPLPFAHVGYMTRAWDEISKRIATVITPTPWSAGDAIRIMEQESVTVGQGVPTQWALVLAHPDLPVADMSSLRVAGTGASRVPPELVRAMRDRLGCPVVVRYTSTETSLGTGTALTDPDDVVATTVGRPVPGVELEIVAEDGTRVSEGQVGRVRMRSAAQMLGYVGRGAVIDSAPTAAVIDTDGWVTTGDLGSLGADGNLRLLGRATEMIIRGGYNIYPSEVEAVVGEHPSVSQVAVVGAPDPVLGEVIVAFVVRRPGSPAPTLESLRSLVRDSLADYKAPDRIEITQQLPTTAMGKVDSRALAELAKTAATDRESEMTVPGRNR